MFLFGERARNNSGLTMERINMKTDTYKIEKMVFGIFLAFGILFFFLGIIISGLVGRQNKDDYVPVTATIAEIERYDRDTHHVYLNYEYDGQEYGYVRYNMYSSSMYVGKEINILVNRYNPTDIYFGHLDTIFLLSFSGFGVLFGLIGGIPIAIIMKKQNHNKKLKENGRAIWGVVEEVCINRNVTVNGTHPKYFVVKYEDDGIVTATSHFKSGSFVLPGDGNEMVGKNIKIFVNPQNNADYVVDLDSIQTEDMYYGF